MADFWERQFSQVKAGNKAALTIDEMQERGKAELELQDADLNRQVEMEAADVGRAAASGVLGWGESVGEAAAKPEFTPEQQQQALEQGYSQEAVTALQANKNILELVAEKGRDWFGQNKEQVRGAMSDNARKALEAEIINENLSFTDDATKLSTWIMKGTETLSRMIPDLVIGGMGSKQVYNQTFDMMYKKGIEKGLTEAGARIAADKVAKGAMSSSTAQLATISATGGTGVQVKETIENTPWNELLKSDTFKANFQVIDQDPKNEAMSNKEKLNLARTMTAEQASQNVQQDPALLTANVAASFLGDATLGRIIQGRIGGGIAEKAVKGFAAEAPTEAGQGAMEQYAQNLVLIDVAGADIDPTKGVARSAVEGAILGGAIGGGVGATTGAVEKVTGREQVVDMPEDQPTEQPEVTEEVAEVAPSVAERRENLEERLRQQGVTGGLGEVQEALSREGAPTPEQLIREAREQQPEEVAVEEPIIEEVEQPKPPTVAERREALNRRLEEQRQTYERERIEKGVGEVQQRLSRPATPSPEELIARAPEETGPTPGELEFRRQQNREYLEEMKDKKIPQGLRGKPGSSRIMNKGYRKAMEDFGSLAGKISGKKELAPEVDTMSKAIEKLGGLDRKLAESEGFDPQSFKRNRAFPTDGKLTFDHAAELLNEQGYRNREGGKLNANDVVDMVYGEVNNNERHLSINADADMLTADADMVRDWSEQIGGPDKLQGAIDKALRGERLGKRQAEIVEDVLETVNSIRSGDIEDARATLTARRQEREQNRIDEFNQAYNDITEVDDTYLSDYQRYEEMFSEMPDNFTEQQAIVSELVANAGDRDYEATEKLITDYDNGDISLPNLLDQLSEIASRELTYEEAKPRIQTISEPTTQPTERSDAERAREIEEPTAAEPEQRIEPEPEASAELEPEAEPVQVDTRGLGQQYHGTSQEIKELAEYTYSESNIFGQGLYTTDAYDVATGYTKKGRGDTPTIYKVVKKKDLNLYDMEAPLSDQIVQIIENVDSDLLDVYERTNPENLRELMNNFRAESSDYNLSKHEVQDVFASLSESLERLGFDGVRHIGGANTDNKPHNVEIFFSPREAVELVKSEGPVTDVEQVAEVEPVAEVESEVIEDADLDAEKKVAETDSKAYVDSMNSEIEGLKALEGEEFQSRAKDIKQQLRVEPRSENPVISKREANKLIAEVDKAIYENSVNADAKDLADKAQFSQDSRTTGTPKGVPIKEAELISKQFLKKYKGAAGATVKVFETQKEALSYGGIELPDDVGVNAYRIPQTGEIVLVAENLDGARDVWKKLRHEILAHHGLYNVVGEKEWLKIMDLVSQSRESSELKETWALIDKHYPELNENLKAEEVIAHIAEYEPGKVGEWADRVISAIIRALRNVGLISSGMRDVEVRDLIRVVGDRIKSLDSANATIRNDIMFSKEIAEESGFSIPDETKKDAFVRSISDKYRRLKVVQESVKEQGGRVTEAEDVYRAEELFHGKTGEDMRVMEESYIKPLQDAMSQRNIEAGELDLYLIAKHAPERNAYIAKINPKMQDGGSGMTNAEAAEILNRFEQEGRTEDMQSAAKYVYDMLANTRDTLVDSGLETSDAVESWSETYKNYVPLKGFANNEIDDKGDVIKPTGKGFNIRGKETMRAMGRRTMADSPLAYAIADATGSIIRARKNEVGQTMLRLVDANPDQELWQVFSDENPDVTRKIVRKKNPLTNKVEDQVIDTVAPMAMMKDKYLGVKMGGEQYYIKLNDPRLMSAMANLGVEQSNLLTRTVGRFTRLLSALITSYNPEFALSNFARDVQTAIYNVMAETEIRGGKAEGIRGLAGQMTKDVMNGNSIKALRKGFRDNDFSGEWGGYLKEFLESGAKTGWFVQKDIDEIKNDIQKSLTRTGPGAKNALMRSKDKMIKFIDDYNDIIENASRLSVYVNGRKGGLSQSQAASLAKNLTVNFNRRGEMTNNINALYMFFNASVQGTVNMLRAIATPKDKAKSMFDPGFYNTTQKIAMMLPIATMGFAALNRSVGGEDDDGKAYYDKIPDYVKETNFVMVIPGSDGDYIKIPMPYGYNFFAGVGHAIDRGINGQQNVIESAFDLASVFAGAFSPLGAVDSEESAVQVVKTASPTMLRPFIEMAVNENFSGSPIYKQQNPFGLKTPDSYNAQRRTWEWSKGLSEWLNDATGGNEFKSGYVDIAPESWQHMVSFVGGGALTTALRTQDYAVKKLTGEEIEDRDVPFWRKYFGNISDSVDVSEMYKRFDEVKEAKNQLEGLPKAEALKFRKDNMALIRLIPMQEQVNKRMRALNKRKREVEANEKLSDDRKKKIVDQIEGQKKLLATKFNKRYNDTVGK